jgi:hypothetical protein
MTDTIAISRKSSRWASRDGYVQPALGPAVPTTQHLALTPTWVGRGHAIAAELPSLSPVVQQGRIATYAHAPE